MSRGTREVEFLDELFDDDLPDGKIDFTEAGDPGKPAGKKDDKSRHFRPAQMGKATEEVREFMKSGDWENATARHFVALYELLHREVYGAQHESTAPDRARASMMAGKLLREQFGGDPGRMAVFMSWSWSRERKQEAWRQANGREGGRRLGWQLQFSHMLVNDYRVDEARMKARANAR